MTRLKCSTIIHLVPLSSINPLRSGLPPGPFHHMHHVENPSSMAEEFLCFYPRQKRQLLPRGKTTLHKTMQISCLISNFWEEFSRSVVCGIFPFLFNQSELFAFLPAGANVNAQQLVSGPASRSENNHNSLRNNSRQLGISDIENESKHLITQFTHRTEAPSDYVGLISTNTRWV